MENKKSFFNYLTPEQIQKKVDFINFYIGADNNASASLVDPNSNVSEKNMGTLKEEMYKFENIQVSRKIIKDKITEMPTSTRKILKAIFCIAMMKHWPLFSLIALLSRCIHFC